jgi:prevent-host-death family protein
MKLAHFEAKNTFGSLLDRVEAGEEIVITRHGRP